MNVPKTSHRVLRGFTLATAIALGAIVVTGGGVRLSDSGLGCPTWPKCTNAAVGSFGGLHSTIEFGNRLITVAITLLIAVTVVLVLRLPRPRRDLRVLAVALVLGVVGDAVIGGLSVRYDLPPALVSVHFLFSMALLWVGLLLHTRAGRDEDAVPTQTARPELFWLSSALVLVSGLVLVIGTLVTGSGPHSGGGHHPRLHITSLRNITQLHADLAMLLTGLVVATLLVARLAPAIPAPARQRATWLAIVVGAQATIGFVQYATHLPAGLILVHIAGAVAVWSLAIGVALGCRTWPPMTAPVPSDARTLTAAATA
ncbi:MAG TPA: COX15/CtaA family protein [Mycobacteriales bacterium]|nr:COX15/CtaA family protein [Mycobacteriales bacterium]